MRPLARSGMTWLAVLAVLTAFFVIRWMTAAGFFTSVSKIAPNICQPIAQLQGPEDFEVDAAHDAIELRLDFGRIGRVERGDA